jgi:hypothetical protein
MIPCPKKTARENAGPASDLKTVSPLSRVTKGPFLFRGMTMEITCAPNPAHPATAVNTIFEKQP